MFELVTYDVIDPVSLRGSRTTDNTNLSGISKPGNPPFMLHDEQTNCNLTIPYLIICNLSFCIKPTLFELSMFIYPS